MGTLPKPWPDLVHLVTRPECMIVSHSRTVWLGGHGGMIGTAPEHGCFIHETRLLSHFEWKLNDGLYTVEATPVEQHSFQVYAIAKPRKTHPGYNKAHSAKSARDSTEQTISLRLATILSDGFHQDADIENFTLLDQEVIVELRLDADFAGYNEVQQQNRKQKGRLHRSLRHEDAAGGRVSTVSWEYEAHHRGHRIQRGSWVSISGLPERTHWYKDRLRAVLRLAPGQRHHLCLEMGGHIEEHQLRPNFGCYAYHAQDNRQRQYATAGARLKSENPEPMRLQHSLLRARTDLAALYMRDLDRTGADPENPAWLPAAGVPGYISVFGRDNLTTGWQSALFGPELLLGSLRVLRELQGTRRDDWRDEQPGRVLHEAHNDPTSVLDYRPQGRYYGSFDSSPFYAICLSEFYHWTGDRDTTLALLPAARAALDWMLRYGHPGPAHFFSYLTHSSQGVKNQGWKDSADAIVDDTGRIVKAPIATASIQGYAYEAMLRMAELEALDGNAAHATKLLWNAHELKKRFNNVFWMEDHDYFAMALDRHGRPVRSIASDPGDALAGGIVAGERARAVVARLFQPDMFSGWGIRTLSADHPAFNPFSYHRGSVWPVENAVVGVGLRRYGFTERLAQLLQAQLEVTSWFEHRRLPEVFSGHGRDREHAFPAIYPMANSPQAWSAGVMPLWVQMLLGLYPYAPLETLFLDPALPDWLPELTLEDVRVGSAHVSLRFWRTENGQTEFEPVHLTGRLRLVRQPSPWSVFATTRERLSDLLDSFAA